MKGAKYIARFLLGSIVMALAFFAAETFTICSTLRDFWHAEDSQDQKRSFKAQATVAVQRPTFWTKFLSKRTYEHVSHPRLLTSIQHGNKYGFSIELKV
jgi:hypothetical protein